MKNLRNRRQFLNQIGQGTLAATIGPVLAAELGLAPKALADTPNQTLHFGEIEPLVSFLQETPLEKLQSQLVEKLRSGLTLEKLISAAALANARTFGGEDYVGFHTFMALSPALNMARQLSSKEAALPVLKVLYRNTKRIQEAGGKKSQVLHAVTLPEGEVPGPDAMHEAVKQRSPQAEALFAAGVSADPAKALEALLLCVWDSPEVHRTVLPFRAWDMCRIAGQEHATTLLRQSLRYCLRSEPHRTPEWDRNGKMLTTLLEEHKLLDKTPGITLADDDFVRKLSHTFCSNSPANAAQAAAAALAEGFSPQSVGEALSLAASSLVLRDPGRSPLWESPGKVAGSTHGDSIGVHGSDEANAWRNLSRVSTGRNVFACLIFGAHKIAQEHSHKDLLPFGALPSENHKGRIKVQDEKALLALLDEAIHDRQQGTAAATVQTWGIQKLPPDAVLHRLLRYAVSEDGALHAEKYFQTVWDDFHTSRPSLRWQHLAALARVTASEYGRPAEGQAEARSLLGVG